VNFADLTRYRQKLIQAASAEKNRIQKVLEDAKCKLSSVVSAHLLASAASRMIKAIMSAIDTDSLAELAVGDSRARKRNSRSPAGTFSRSSWFYEFKASLDHNCIFGEDHWPNLDRQIKREDEDYHRERELLASIPGVKEQGFVLNPGRDWCG